MRELFKVNGICQIIEGQKRFVPNSPSYLNQKMATLPLNTKIVMVMETPEATRSSAQLAYHFVLMDLLGEHTGYTKSEMHDAVLRLKYGIKEVRLGDKITDVRQSISDSANFPKHEMVELIQYDLSLCRDLNVHVPTMKELGYMVDEQGNIIK